jgi:hypothetical protein
MRISPSPRRRIPSFRTAPYCLECTTDPDPKARAAELRHLEQTTGRTGLLALSPLFHFPDRDLWQHHMLGKR